MSNSATFGLLLLAGAIIPGVASGQGSTELAIAKPHPHFVAAWAPKNEQEAEHSAALARRVSLELRDVSLDAALKALTNQAGLRITYSKSMLPAWRRVTINASDIAVVAAMTEMLFRSGLDVVVDRDGALALVACQHRVAKTEVQDSGAIVGAVTDRATGAPITGASVVVEDAHRSAITGSDGTYRLNGIEPGTHTVLARYIGYGSQAASVVVVDGEEARADFELEKSVQRLDDVVTTGTVVPTEVRAIPSPVTVITAEEIERLRPRTTNELFRQMVPSGVAWDLGAFPTQTPMSVRGGSTLQGSTGTLKVFIDGIEVSDQSRAAVDPNSIERIEVVRGPQAASLYGSDAIGGVVQVFTKKGEHRTRPEIGAEVGYGVVESPYSSFGTGSALQQEYRGSLTGGSSGATYSLGGGYARTGEWFPTGKQSIPSLHGGARLRQGALGLGVSARYFETTSPANFNPEGMRTGWVVLSRPFFRPIKTVEQSYGIGITYDATPRWAHKITVGIDALGQYAASTEPRLTTPADTLLQTSGDNRTKTYLAYNTSLTATLTSRVSAILTAGVDHYNFRNEAYFAFGALSTNGTIETAPTGATVATRTLTTNTGYFAQTQLSIDDAAFLTAGLRAEDNSDFGTELGTPVSPRVGLSYVRSVGRNVVVKLRGAYGEAIRAPGPGQRDARLGTISDQVANSGLGPERQRGWDAGVDLTIANTTSLSLTYYSQVASDLIQLVELNPSTSQYQNVAKVNNRGLELSGTASFGVVQLAAQYAYARSRVSELGPTYAGDLRTGERPFQIPEHTAGASIGLTPLAGTSIAAAVTYVGGWTYYDVLAQWRCFGGTAPCRDSNREYLIPYPGFAKVSLSVSQQFASKAWGYLTVSNLTNNDAFESTNSTPVIGRLTVLGIRVKY